VLVLGLDIGGANIKAATSDGGCASLAFAIWKNKNGLLQELKQLPLVAGIRPDLVALTMTAELADCFDSKAEGVEFIITTVAEAFPDSVVRVWLTSGEFAEPHDAIELPQLVAAANWHALATWAGRAVPVGPALLIDVGSTTTDVIPLLNGIPAPHGFTDLQRLAYSELVYTGVRRTPVCAIMHHVPLLDESQTNNIDTADTLPIPVAAELFATSLDVHLINEDIAADPQDCNTADGRPATREAAMNRLAQVVCCDRCEISDVQLSFIARRVADQQTTQIAAAVIDRLRYVSDLAGVSPDSVQILLSGSGDWLAEKAIANCNIVPQLPPIQLRTMFVRNVTDSACAFAVARLAAERCLDDLLPVSDLHGQS
jgi:(4-(4-[2-(gamma-L-glutamylamino)ethyl]phenoxymethyl)furan-2-yl)methanamine synthase